MGGHHNRDRLDEALYRWFKDHGTEYPPTSICSHVRYRIWYRKEMSKKGVRWTPPKGGRHPPCLAEDGNWKTNNLFIKSTFRHIPTY